MTYSGLHQKLADGRFLYTAEVIPPKSADPEKVRGKVAPLTGWVDAVNFTDNQLAVVRLSSIAASKICLDLGMEPVLQITCRDRNRLALQSDILGASAMGIHNIFCLTGDPVSIGNHPQAKSVYDLRVSELIAQLKKMRDESLFFNGEPLRGKPPSLFIGCAASPFQGEISNGIHYLKRKLEAGADFIQTQPIFDVDRFRSWVEAFRKEEACRKAYLLAGVMLIKSLKNLSALRDVPGVFIPPPIARILESAADPRPAGIRLCQEIIRELRQIPGIHGVHLMTLGSEDAVPEILKGCATHV